MGAFRVTTKGTVDGNVGPDIPRPVLRSGGRMLKIADAFVEISAKMDKLKAARTSRTWKPVDGRGLRNRSQTKEMKA